MVASVQVVSMSLGLFSPNGDAMGEVERPGLRGRRCALLGRSRGGAPHSLPGEGKNRTAWPSLWLASAAFSAAIVVVVPRDPKHDVNIYDEDIIKQDYDNGDHLGAGVDGHTDEHRYRDERAEGHLRQADVGR
jgi:hypothetical protein